RVPVEGSTRSGSAAEISAVPRAPAAGDVVSETGRTGGSITTTAIRPCRPGNSSETLTGAGGPSIVGHGGARIAGSLACLRRRWIAGCREASVSSVVPGAAEDSRAEPAALARPGDTKAGSLGVAGDGAGCGRRRSTAAGARDGAIGVADDA